MPSPQQQRVFDLIRESPRPLSADEVRTELGFNTVGQATVYRAIRAGVETGELKLVEIPGTTPRYEAANLKHHHHFSCRSCNKVFDLDGCPGGLKKLLPEGFELEDHEILLFGRCDQCA